jgi:hypothetical protein
MSRLHSRPSASIAAWSLLSMIVIFLAMSAQPMLTTTEPSRADEHVSLEAAKPERVEQTDRDPSVPAASSVTFPARDAGEPAIEPF